jgi:RimJ/RimL family protein N-acetyltransferase
MEWARAQPIRTERLELEPLSVDHADAMVDVLASPSLHTFIGGEPPSHAELEARYRRQSVGASPDGSQGWLNWVVRERSGPSVGTVRATLRATVHTAPDGDSPDDELPGGLQADVAWVIGPASQGRGYATEAAAAMVEWLVAGEGRPLDAAGIGITRVVAFIHPDHVASAAVAAHLGLAPTPELEDGEIRWDRDVPADPGDGS